MGSYTWQLPIPSLISEKILRWRNKGRFRRLCSVCPHAGACTTGVYEITSASNTTLSSSTFAWAYCCQATVPRRVFLLCQKLQKLQGKLKTNVEPFGSTFVFN